MTKKKNKQEESDFSESEDSASSHDSVIKHKKKEKKKPDFRKRGHTNHQIHTIVMNVADCQYPVVKSVGRELGWKLQFDPQAADWDLFWTDYSVQPDIVLKMHQHQKLNHFPGMYNLARKNFLGKNLMKMRKRYPQEYDYFPLTWMLPSQYSDFRIYYESKPRGKCRTYIAKPEALSQGKGIFLTRSIEDLELGQHYVVQRYCTKPYLIDKLKFDLRLYVLVASVTPLRLFIYEQGLARFATEPYQIPNSSNIDDIYMHLTNYAINKENPKFIGNRSQKRMDVGHKRSLSSIFQRLKSDGHNVQQLKEKIKDVIIKSVISGMPLISHQYKACQPQNFSSDICFQILGLDILLTEDVFPVVLQINHTPSFTTDSPLDKYIKYNLIKDTLVLMNFSINKKIQMISKWKEECANRILTGKKSKLSKQEKEEKFTQAQLERDKWESQNMGRYKKIYPSQQAQKMLMYQEFYKYAQEIYYEQTRLRRKENQVDKIDQKKKIKADLQKERNQMKIRKSKIQRSSRKGINSQKSKISQSQIIEKQSTLVKTNESINSRDKTLQTYFLLIRKSIISPSSFNQKFFLNKNKNHLKHILDKDIYSDHRRKNTCIKDKLYRLQILDEVCKNSVREKSLFMEKNRYRQIITKSPLNKKIQEEDDQKFSKEVKLSERQKKINFQELGDIKELSYKINRTNNTFSSNSNIQSKGIYIVPRNISFIQKEKLFKRAK